MLDSGCLILEKSFIAEIAENAEFAEKAAKSNDFEGKTGYNAAISIFS